MKKHILEIRKVLGDRTRTPVFIETISKRGYQFVAVRDVPVGAQLGTDLAAPATMVGRDTAMRQLAECLDRAFSGERQLVFATGEAGVGKTTLVDAFHREAAPGPGCGSRAVNARGLRRKGAVLPGSAGHGSHRLIALFAPAERRSKVPGKIRQRNASMRTVA